MHDKENVYKQFEGKRWNRKENKSRQMNKYKEDDPLDKQAMLEKTSKWC